MYYHPRKTDEYNQLLLDLIDKQYTRVPFYGSPRLTDWLQEQGHHVNIKRVKRLMKTLGLVAIQPKRNLSKKNHQHKIYPYLLNGVEINSVNQVWSTDITYIRLRSGFMYLVAVIDWYSRYVLSWELSNTLDNQFCINALKAALELGKPEIFNTDQGAQFTSNDFIGLLKEREIKISMDGKGRAFDNIFVERLWRTVKYELIYLNEFDNVLDLYKGLDYYFDFYNHIRGHQSLARKKPAAVFFGNSN